MPAVDTPSVVPPNVEDVFQGYSFVAPSVLFAENNVISEDLFRPNPDKKPSTSNLVGCKLKVPPGPSMLRFEALSTWTMPVFPNLSPAVSQSEIAFQSRFWTMPHYCSNTPRGIVHMDNATFSLLRPILNECCNITTGIVQHCLQCCR